MEKIDKELKELGEQRMEQSLSLRKKKLNKFLLKRRLGLSDDNYSIKKGEIIIREEYKTKTFNDLADLLNFASTILGNEKSDSNDIKFVICLLKETQIKNDKGEVSKSNLIKEMTKIFVKYIDDKIIIDELICILINITYYLQVETNMNLLTNDYLQIYSKISEKYFNDNIIFNDLITLMGNLANDNIIAQKIFYETKLFEELYSMSQNPKTPKVKKDISIWFLAIFTNGIQKNNNFINNIELFKSLIDIMAYNVQFKEYSLFCLFSLGHLSEIREIVDYLVKKKDLFIYIFEKNKPDYYTMANKILINITSYNEDINLYLIQNYNAIPYILKLIDSPSNIIKGQIIFFLGNIIENKPSKINEIIYSYGLYDKIFDCLNSPFVEILDKVIYILNIILISLNNEGIFKLYQKNIHLKLMNILKNDYKRDVLVKTIDAIIEFLQKDTQDGVIKQSFIDNGIKEVLFNMEFDRNDTEIVYKTNEILKNYF
jgi:hypothetical protein